MVSNNGSLEWNTYDTTFKGLKNELGRNNCFLNVVIQSLWHLASFRHQFLQSEQHLHSKRELTLRRRRSQIARTNSMSSASASAVSVPDIAALAS